MQLRRDEGLYRSRRITQGPQGPSLSLDTGEVLSFCSNDYLGLANHPDVIAAFVDGANRYGVGSGSAHLISGHSHAHHALEEELAEFTGYPRTLLFSTGYMANLGVVSALLDRHGAAFEDKLNHASLLDASALAQSKLIRYRHADHQHLAERLAQSDHDNRLIISDGVFSMDGDLAPLVELSQLARQYHAPLMIDDAHGFGVLGQQGRGIVEQFQLSHNEIPILVGTLGKAFGTFGAFVAGDETLIETLIQKSRSYIYTTAMPAAVAEATRCSLKLLQQESWRREKLQALIQQFRRGAEQLGLTLMASQTPIQPLLIGDSKQASTISEQLLDKGILISAIRPPTVPQGSARLRITFSAAHSEKDVDLLLSTLEALQ